MDLFTIRKLVENDLSRVDEQVDKALSSDISLIPLLGRHLIHSVGKRLRPLVALLAAHAFGYQGHDHIALAASLELIHTATLLHDDVVDVSHLRRNKPTANALWGNPASVLVGDFLYSRAFQLMVNVQHWHVLQSLADTTNRIAEGEILQLTQCHNIDLEESDCLKVIRAKTGLLFATAAIQGALLTQSSSKTVQLMADYGMHLGIAFQLVDDALDYSANSEILGKNQGDDLAEGKVTLPLLCALKRGNAKQVAIIRDAIKAGKREYLHDILVIIESTGAISYTYQLAKQYAGQAADYLQQIPASIYQEALSALTIFAVDRSS